MSESPHLGVQLASAGVTWSELRDAARRVESLGYDSLWVPDHLAAWRSEVSRFEAWQVLAALAVVTTRIRIGPLVSPVTFRHPSLVAKMAVTLDHISAGRVILGLGAGGMMQEHRQFGLRLGTPRQRIERLEEAATIIRGLLDDSVRDFTGHYYQLRDARPLPKPVQRHLPLLVAGLSDRTVRIAARVADLWNGIGLPAVFRARVLALHAELDAARRDPASVVVTASFRLIIRGNEHQIARRLDELDPVWREDAYRVVGDVSHVIGELSSYLSAGVTGFIVQMPAPYDLATIEQLAAEVRPRLSLAGG